MGSRPKKIPKVLPRPKAVPGLSRMQKPRPFNLQPSIPSEREPLEQLLPRQRAQADDPERRGPYLTRAFSLPKARNQAGPPRHPLHLVKAKPRNKLPSGHERAPRDSLHSRSLRKSRTRAFN